MIKSYFRWANINIDGLSKKKFKKVVIYVEYVYVSGFPHVRELYLRAAILKTCKTVDSNCIWYNALSSVCFYNIYIILDSMSFFVALRFNGAVVFKHLLHCLILGLIYTEVPSVLLCVDTFHRNLVKSALVAY